jgi:hypothetical protein
MLVMQRDHGITSVLSLRFSRLFPFVNPPLHRLPSMT